jgi:hypothetical protein
MSNQISDLKRNLERQVGGKSGEHQPTRVIKPDSEFSKVFLPGYESELEFYFAFGDTNVFTGPISRSANDMSLLCTFSKGDRNA